MGNPFTPTFGIEPMFMAGRSRLIDDIVAGLANRPGDPNRSTLFVGPRGSGKTVLLSKVVEAAAANGWVAAQVTTGPDMGERLLELVRRAGQEFLAPSAKSRVTGVSVSGLGLTREVSQAQTTWGYRFSELVEQLNQRSVGLLVAVDEVNADSPDMVALAIEYQRLVGLHADVALVMAGLPGKVSQLLQTDSISFLRRSFRRPLGSVTLHDAAEAIGLTLEASGREIEPAALEVVAAASEGYPFLIQLVGYHLWRLAPATGAIAVKTAEMAKAAAEAEMDQMILETTIRELSKKDLAFLVAMARDEEDSSMGDIAARLSASPSLAGKYRRRLMEQGLIAATRRGVVHFELPMLRRYIVAHHLG
jgi:hypothetical protein